MNLTVVLHVWRVKVIANEDQRIINHSQEISCEIKLIIKCEHRILLMEKYWQGANEIIRRK